MREPTGGWPPRSGREPLQFDRGRRRRARGWERVAVAWLIGAVFVLLSILVVRLATAAPSDAPGEEVAGWRSLSDPRLDPLGRLVLGLPAHIAFRLADRRGGPDGSST